MLITTDNLVHRAKTPEDIEHYGRTMCARRWTTRPYDFHYDASTLLQGVQYVRAGPVTCLGCLARGA